MNELHLYELHLIKLFQEIRNPFWDGFFKFFNLIDTGYFVFFLIPIIWMGFNWKLGAKLLFILFLNFYLNALFKALFHQPRPYHLDPSLAVIHVKDFGFPSGGAQNAVLYCGLLIGLWKNKWSYILGPFFLICMSISRIYLGVHFFSDVLGGYIVGALLLLIYFYLFPRLEKGIKKIKDFRLIILSFFLAFFLFLSLKSPFVKMVSVAFFFIIVGLIISKKYDLFLYPSSTFLEGFLRTLFTWLGIGAIAALFAFSFEKSNFTILFATGLLALWLSSFASLFWKKTFGKLQSFKK